MVNRYEVQMLWEFREFVGVDWFADESRALGRAQSLSHQTMTRVFDNQQHRTLTHFWRGYQVGWWDMVQEVFKGVLKGWLWR